MIKKNNRIDRMILGGIGFSKYFTQCAIDLKFEFNGEIYKQYIVSANSIIEAKKLFVNYFNWVKE